MAVSSKALVSTMPTLNPQESFLIEVLTTGILNGHALTGGESYVIGREPTRS